MKSNQNKNVVVFSAFEECWEIQLFVKIKNTTQITDKFAPFREFWEKCILNCKKCKLSPNVTINEQLVGAHFPMCLLNKSSKYRIKILMLTYSGTKYVYNAMSYLSEDTNPANVPVATYFVKKLCEPLKGSNNTITMNNWFTSTPFACFQLHNCWYIA